VIDIDQVIKEVSLKTGIDKDLVSVICKHVFQYTVDTMKDEDNTKDILFNRLFKFKLKRRYKENKKLKYTSK